MTATRAIASWQLRETRRSAVAWGAALAALCVLEVAIYPSVHTTLAKVVENYPRGLKEAFNIHELSTVQAFLDVEMFSLMIPLVVGFFAIRCVTHALAGAEERRWLDVLLAAPVTRRELSWGAILGTANSVGLLLLVIAVPTELASVIAGETLPLDLLLSGLVGVWVLGLLCAATAALGSGMANRGATVTAAGMGLLVGMYVLNLVGKLAPSLGVMRWASVFRYTEGALKDGLDVAAAAAVLLAAAAVARVGAWLFAAKDLR